MGLFGTLKGIVGGVGDVVKKASPLAAFIPGVGAPLAAAIGAGGALLGKANDKHVTIGNTLGSMAGGAAMGGIGGYGIDKLQSGGIGGLTSSIGGLAGHAGSAANPGGLGGVASGLMKFAKENPQLLLAGAGMLNSAHQQSGADNQRNASLDLLRQDMQNRQPLFQMMMQRMASQPKAPDVSGVFRDPSNPFG